MAPDDARDGATNRLGVVAGAVAVVGVIGYLALGMPGMDHSGGTGGNMPGMDHSSAEMSYDLVAPAAFEQRLNGDAFVVNVHSPYDGEIPGTTAFIPVSDVRSARELPAVLDTPILVYCRTGRMSADAADTLVAAGYTHVVVLDEGMDGWEASGRAVLVDAARA